MATIDPEKTLDLKTLNIDHELENKMPDGEVDGKVIDTEDNLKKKKKVNGQQNSAFDDNIGAAKGNGVVTD